MATTTPVSYALETEGSEVRSRVAILFPVERAGWRPALVGTVPSFSSLTEYNDQRLMVYSLVTYILHIERQRPYSRVIVWRRPLCCNSQVVSGQHFAVSRPQVMQWRSRQKSMVRRQSESRK